MDEETLLSISEASRLMGVSEPALRQWTDEGKLKAFITPGGHRRYSRAELKKFMSSHHKMSVKDLAVELENTAGEHRAISLSFLTGTAWYGKLDARTQGDLAALGRRLLSLIIKAITEPSRRDETLSLMREVGSSFGEKLAGLGLPLTDSVHAFILHREPIVDTVTRLMRKEGYNRRVADAIALINQAMDEALVALVAAYQSSRSSSISPRSKDSDDIDFASAV